jgi:hypothetical protein
MHLAFSFLTNIAHSRFRYDSGFYSWHKELAEDFKLLFLRLWDEAEKHTLLELTKPKGARCKICEYWQSEYHALRPK